MTYRPDISGAKQEDLVGKHVLDIYPGLTEETSTIMRVLRSGEPIYNEYQTLITCREEVFQSVNTTMPIRAGGTGEIIGAIDVSRYASRFYEKQSINLHSAHTRKGPFYCVDDIITCSEDIEAIKTKNPIDLKNRFDSADHRTVWYRKGVDRSVYSHLKQPGGQGICISKLCRNTCDAAGEHPLRYNQGKLHWSRKQAGTLRDCKWGNVIS